MEIPFGYIKNGKLFRSAFGPYPDLLLKEHFSQDETDTVVDEFLANYGKLEGKLAEVIEKIESSQNKASFLSGLTDLKNGIADHQGLGNYPGMMEKIRQYESLLQDYVSKNRQKNTDIKKALLLEMQVAAQNNDMVEAFEQVKNIKSRWLKTGSPSPEIKEELESGFKKELDAFFEKRKAFQDAKDELSQARVSDYESIIEQIQEIVKSGSHIKSRQQVQKLQADWKEKGRIPEKQFKVLNERYWKICQQFYDELKVKRSDLKKNRTKNEKDSLTEREGIIAQLEGIANQPLNIDNKTIDHLKKNWKTSGPVSKEKFEPLQKKFSELNDMVKEQAFVLSTAKKRNTEYGKMSIKDQAIQARKILNGLIRRDEDELRSFQENMDKMHINQGSFVDMLEAKLDTHKRKIELKKKILVGYNQLINGTHS